MRGSERIWKRQIKRAGWEIVEESGGRGEGYRLVLRGPGGEELRIEAATKPRAYHAAWTRVAGPAHAAG